MALMASIAYGFLLIGAAIIVISIFFVMLPSLSNQSAFGTFPGENGKIAFVSNRASVQVGEIFVMDADGASQTKLTTHTTTNGNPDWSPDGTKIALMAATIMGEPLTNLKSML
jgi:WD40-like Beta Propeller Repeat